MNKKFLSAILFGALTVASTGSFVSCKDYDDDIKNLQTQIGQLASKSDLQSQVGALETSLTAAKTSAESAVKTAAEAVAAAKDAAAKADAANTAAGNAQNAANAANGAATDAKTAAEAAAAAVKVAEEKLAAAEEKVAAIEAELASVKTLKAELESYTEAEVAKLQNKINAEVEALNAKVQALVGLHYVDLLIDPAYPAGDAKNTVSMKYAKFNPTATNTRWNNVQYKALLEVFPEIADLKNETLTDAGQFALLVSPAQAKMMSEYTYELINDKEEVVPVALSNPQQGLTRASGSEYWTLDATPTFKKDGITPNELKTNDKYALRVKEGEEVLYKTQFAFNATSTQAQAVSVTVAGNRVSNGLMGWTIANRDIDFASEIDLINDKLFDYNPVDDVKESPLFTIKDGYKNYYVITVEDDASNHFYVEKYGISVNGSKLVIKKKPTDIDQFSLKLTIVALGINGSTTTANAVVKILNNVDAKVELAAKTIEAAKKDTLLYSLEDLGLTGSKINGKNWTADVYKSTDDVKFSLTDIDAANVSGKDKIEYFDANKKPTTDVKKAAYVAVVIPANAQLPADEYTIALTLKSGSTVGFKGIGSLTVVNPDLSIKLVEALTVDGVLQAVGEYKNGYIEYNIDKALIYDKTKITLGGSANGNAVPALVDDDATKTEDWTAPTTDYPALIKVRPNGTFEDVEYKHINSTVRNMTINYHVGASAENLLSKAIQVKMISAVYSEKAEDVIKITNPSIFFTATPNANPADNSVKISDIVKAYYAKGNDATKEYKLLPVIRTVSKSDAQYLVNYKTPYSEVYKVWVSTDADAAQFDAHLLSNKDKELVEFSVNDLFKAELITAYMKETAEAQTVYLSTENKYVYYKYSKDGVVKFVQCKDIELAITESNIVDEINKYYFVNTASNPTYKTTKVTKDNASVLNGAAIYMLKTGDVYSYESNPNAALLTTNAKKVAAIIGTIKFAPYEAIYVSVPAEVMHNEITEARSTNINELTIKFDNEPLAAKFVKKTSWTNSELTDEFVDEIEANQDYDSSQLEDNKITLKATMTIVDAWGLKMEVPFEVTCKVNTK